MQLITRRFLLRDFEASDEAAFLAYHADPRSHEFHGEEHAAAHASELLGRFRDWAATRPRRNFQLAWVLRHPPHALVGCCGLRRADAAPGHAELGLEMAPAYWGRHGYALEVLRSLVEFGFDELGLVGIHGGTVSANHRIARLVQALGATAVTRPSPPWMVARGWSKVEWQVTHEQWRQGRLRLRRRRPGGSRSQPTDGVDSSHRPSSV